MPSLPSSANPNLTLTLTLTLRRYPQLPPFLSSTWFPDRRGLVVSIYMTSFGSGMLFAVPVLQALLAHFRTAPVRP
jgi:hypothetical protein